MEENVCLYWRNAFLTMIIIFFFLGAFEVTINGKLQYSKLEDQYFPDVDEVGQAIQSFFISC